MISRRRNIAVGIGLLIAIVIWECKVFSIWSESARLIPARVTPLDSRHNNAWLDAEQRVVSFLTRYIDPKTGETTSPFFSGPVLLRDPRSGETEVIVAADVENLAGFPQIVRRYLIPTQLRGLSSFVVRRYYLSETRSSASIPLPDWIPAVLRQWMKSIVPGQREHRMQLTLFDAATELPIATVATNNWKRQEVFARDGSGFALIYSDRCEWFSLPPQVVRENVWAKAILPPLIVVAAIPIVSVCMRRYSKCR